MKTKQVGKKILSGLLMVCLVAGSIAIAKPQKADAAGDNLVANGGFDTTADWYNTSSNTDVAMPEQQEVEDVEVTEHFLNGDFEDESYDYSTSWWSESGLTCTVESEENGNKMLHVKDFAQGKCVNVGVDLKANKAYTIQFEMKASVTGIKYHLFGVNAEGWDPLFTFNATSTKWETYTYEYTTTEAYTQLVFQNPEGTNGDLYIDNFSVTTEKPSVFKGDQFLNGDFEDATYDYSTSWWSESGLTCTVESEEYGNKMFHVKDFAQGKCVNVGVDLKADKEYTIQFDMKASVTGIKYHLFGVNAEGWDPLFTFNATSTKWETYTYEYTTTEAYTQLVFQNPEDTNGDLYIDNFSLITELSRMEEVEQFLSGDLEDETCDYTASWWSESGLTWEVASEENGNKMFHAKDFAPGKCVNVGIKMEAGKTYTVSFDIKGSAAGLAYHLFGSGDGWANNVLVVQAKEIGTEWTRHTYTYTPEYAYTQFIFQNPSGTTGDLYIDNFSVITEQPRTLSAEHFLNGDLEDKTYDYTASWWSESGLAWEVASEENENKMFHAKDFAPGKCVNVGIKMEAGKTYTVSFDIKGSVAGLAYHLFGSGDGWAHNALVVQARAIGTEWTRHTYTYTPEYANTQFIFQNPSGTTGDLYIDNFSVVIKRPMLVEVENFPNGDFKDETCDYTASWWSESGLTWEVASEENGNKMFHAKDIAPGKCVNVGIKMEAGKTYTVSFDIKGSAAGLAYHLFGSGDGWANNVLVVQAKEIGTEWTRHTYTYTPEYAYTQFIFQNPSGTTGDLYIDNFSVTSMEISPTYSDGVGTCLGFETDNVLAMKKMKEATYKNVSFTAGKTYTYYYQVKTDKAASVTFVVGEQNVQTVEATSEWTNIKGIFTAESDTTELSFVRSGEGSLLIDDIVVYEGIKEHEIKRYYNISNGDYLLTSSSGNLVVEENETLTAGDKITVNDLKDTNVFHISRIENGELWKETVVLYIPGDANEDEAFSAKDLVAMKWAEAGTSEKQNARLAGTYASDLDRNGEVNDIDLRALRLALVSDDAKAELAVSKSDSLLGGEMPIAGFDMPREGNGSELINDDFYKKVKDANINSIVWSFDGYYQDGYGLNADKHMTLADKYGLKMWVHDFSTDVASTDRFTEENFAKRVGRYSMYESFAGIHIVDEPDSDTNPLSPECEKKISIFKNDIDLCNSTANISGYVNYFPCYPTALNQSEYRERYQTYLKEVYTDTKAEMLSVDHYPFGSSEFFEEWYRNENRKYLYQNLDMMRTEANKSENEGKPFWSFAQLTIALAENEIMGSDSQYMTPAEIQWQVNTALAMGARGIQYWSVYAEPNYSAMANDGYAGLIKPNGEPSNYYNAVKEQNWFVKVIDEVLMNATNVGVFVNDSTASNALNEMNSSVVLKDEKSDVLKSVTGENALVGCFDYYGKAAFYVVNCDTDAAQDITLTYDNPCKAAVTNFESDAVNQEFAAEATSTTISVGAGQAALVIVD